MQYLYEWKINILDIPILHKLHSLWGTSCLVFVVLTVLLPLSLLSSVQYYRTFWPCKDLVHSFIHHVTHSSRTLIDQHDSNSSMIPIPILIYKTNIGLLRHRPLHNILHINTYRKVKQQGKRYIKRYKRSSNMVTYIAKDWLTDQFIGCLSDWLVVCLIDLLIPSLLRWLID